MTIAALFMGHSPATGSHAPVVYQLLSTACCLNARFIQTLRTILRLQSALADCAVLRHPDHSAPVVYQLPSCVPRQRLATPAINKYASLTTLLQSWFSATSSTEQRQLVDWPPAWSKTEVIVTRKSPDTYTRVTLKDKLGKGNMRVLHPYAVREALTSGLLIVAPAFPVLTATAVAKQQNVSTRQMPFQAAALILIFTPVKWTSSASKASHSRLTN